MSSEVAQPGEEIGDYVDSDNFERSAHIDTDGNFSENIGSRTIKTVTATTGPYASLPSLTFTTKKLSNHVDLQIPSYSANANATATTVITFPAVVAAHDRPRADKYFPIVLIGTNATPTNATPLIGYVRVVHDTGNLVIQIPAGNTWTNGQVAAWQGIDVGWDCKY